MDPYQAADLLRAARAERRTLSPFTDTHPLLDEAWGYKVQATDRAQRAGADEQMVGAKLGLTSVAKQRRMGIERPIVGFLTDAMTVEAHELDDAMTGWVQPRIEPEIAFRTTHTIDHALTPEEVEACIATVMVAAEIIDSRWTDYRFRLPDVVADNTSAAGVLVGARQLPLSAVGDLASLRCEVEIDGEIAHSATGAAILGHPLRAVQLLSEHLERHGQSLPPGSFVLAGALTDAVPLTAGRRYRLCVEQLGSLTATPAP